MKKSKFQFILVTSLFTLTEGFAQSNEEINALKDQAASSTVYLVTSIVLLIILIIGAVIAMSKIKSLKEIEQRQDGISARFKQQIHQLNEELKDCRVQGQGAYQKLQAVAAKNKEIKSVFKEAYDKVVAQNNDLKTRLGLNQVQGNQSELEKIYSKLEDAQAMVLHSEKMASLGQLTAGIAHEINNPVNFVSNGVNSIKDCFGKYKVFVENYRKVCELDDLQEIKKNYNIIRGDDKAYDELEQITEESIDDVSYGTQRITEIVNGLRTFSRQDEHEVKEAQISTVIDNALLILKPKYKKKAKILKDFDHNIKAIKCLPGQLNQALVNLIGNAADAIEFKGTITIRTIEKDADTVQIQVQDDGKGIPEDTRRKIFDPFFTTKPVGKGTGLGLSITYGIIEKHGGTIVCDSEVGKGTIFTINLPKKIKLKKSKD